MTSPMTASLPRSESWRKSAPPTMQMPVKMTAIPTQRNHSSCFLRKILEKMPTKIMMEPRSIWNCEALVMVRLTYIMVVATTSHSAGGRKMYHLGVGVSLASSLVSSLASSLVPWQHLV